MFHGFLRGASIPSYDLSVISHRHPHYRFQNCPTTGSLGQQVLAGIGCHSLFEKGGRML
jgi:hypothetical protein